MFSEKLPKIPLSEPSLLHQLRVFGSQQHPQIEVLSTSFSNWGTENILVEINLESMGMINGYNILWMQIWQTLEALYAEA
jgi:hypothetical protein